jgi:hypothetical protein
VSIIFHIFLMKLSELPRNDVEAAVRFVEDHLDAGDFGADDGQTLIMLQDDASALCDAIETMIERRREAGKPLGVFE